MWFPCSKYYATSFITLFTWTDHKIIFKQILLHESMEIFNIGSHFPFFSKKILKFLEHGNATNTTWIDVDLCKYLSIGSIWFKIGKDKFFLFS